MLINERVTINGDTERSDNSLFKVLLQYLPWQTEENNEKTQVRKALPSKFVSMKYMHHMMPSATTQKPISFFFNFFTFWYGTDNLNTMCTILSLAPAHMENCDSE